MSVNQELVTNRVKDDEINAAAADDDDIEKLLLFQNIVIWHVFVMHFFSAQIFDGTYWSFGVPSTRVTKPIQCGKLPLSLQSTRSLLRARPKAERVHRQLAEIFHIERPSPTRPDPARP